MEHRAVELSFSIRQLAETLHMPVSRVHKTLQRQRRVDPLEWLDWAVALRINDTLHFLRNVKELADGGRPPPRTRRTTNPRPKPGKME